MVPWKLVTTAAQFLQFMNGYGCIVCAIVSIMISDYWLVRRRKLDVPALYNPYGRYRYLIGVNWRAAVTQLLFMAISLPGVVAQINPSMRIPIGLQRIYELSWFINTFGPLILYYLLHKIFPAKETMVAETISVVLVSGLETPDTAGSSTEDGAQLKEC